MTVLRNSPTHIKKLIVIALILLGAPLSQAQEFVFKFTFKGETWSHPVTAEKWSAALEKASQDCLNHFAKSHGSQKIRVDADTADALLNTCTNPR